MKKVIIFAAAVMMMSSCGALQNSSSSNTQQAATTQQTAVAAQPAAQQAPTALSAGQGAGTAIQALYSQYKADGNKFDYKNMQNILNTLALVNHCEGLKSNYKDKEYLGEFGKGLLAGSLGLVSQNNVETVTNNLVDLVKNNETVQATQTKVQEGAATIGNYANTASQYAGAIGSLMSLFSGK